jgi:hypothetical protein
MLVVDDGQEHDHGSGSRCWGCVLLAELLRLGAKATAPGYAIGALQVAVALRDLAAVKLLLEAGVDPNAIGDTEGEVGTPARAPMFKTLESLRGRTPLNVLKEWDAVFDALGNTVVWVVNQRDGWEEVFETTLVQYGARDEFTPVQSAEVVVAEG